MGTALFGTPHSSPWAAARNANSAPFRRGAWGCERSCCGFCSSSASWRGVERNRPQAARKEVTEALDIVEAPRRHPHGGRRHCMHRHTPPHGGLGPQTLQRLYPLFAENMYALKKTFIHGCKCRHPDDGGFNCLRRRSSARMFHVPSPTITCQLLPYAGVVTCDRRPQ